MDSSSNVSNDPDPDLLKLCDNLVDHRQVHAARFNFMTKAVESYEHATALLGYFSQLLDFQLELAQLNYKLTTHRQSILESYIDILPQETIKSLTIPSVQTKLYQKGIHKFRKVKNYIVYHYKQKLYTELELEPKRINNIREIVGTISRLDKHYDIYQELVVDLQKKNKAFDQIMYKHLPEFVHF
jgi:hypothetical protein